MSDVGDGAIATVGTPSPTAQAIYALSLAIPIAVLAVFFAVVARSETPPPDSLGNSVLVLIAAAFLWHYD